MRKLFEAGASYDLVRASMEEFTDEEIKEVYEQVKIVSQKNEKNTQITKMSHFLCGIFYCAIFCIKIQKGELL